MVFSLRLNYNCNNEKILILLFLSLGLSSPVLADEAFDLWDAGRFFLATQEFEKKNYQGYATS